MSRDIIKELYACAFTKHHNMMLVVELIDHRTGETYIFKYDISNGQSPALLMAHAKEELAKQWSGN